MKAYLDNNLLKRIISDASESTLKMLSNAFDQVNLPHHLQIHFGWPSLLEYLGEGSIFVDFPTFDDQSSLFIYLKKTLSDDPTPDSLFKLYDQIFAECLTLVKNLPLVNAEYLLNKIHQQQQRPSFTPTKVLFQTTLEKFEFDLTNHPSHALHDLTLYLGWDRMCVVFATIFDHIFSDEKSQEGLKIFNACLIESFQHITQHGRTMPGFYRWMEAYYAYQMREENIKAHSEKEWQILCHSSYVLKARDSLPDVPYVDTCIVHKEDVAKGHHEIRVIFTADTNAHVQARLDMAQFTLAKLTREESGWAYSLSPAEILCLK